MNTSSRNILIVFISMLYAICYMFHLPVLAQSDLAADAAAGFIAQGEITNCLKQEVLDENVARKIRFLNAANVTIHLTGLCESSTGSCDIVFKWSENWVAARGFRCPRSEQIDGDCGAAERAFYADNPITVPGSRIMGQVPVGPVSYDVAVGVHKDVYYNFYAVGKGEVTQAGSTGDTGEAFEIGQDLTLKQGELAFPTPTPISVFDSSSETCAAISWDPYGRVFDAVSLEPMYGVDITMMEKSASGALVPVEMKFSRNMDTTDDRGLYNILIEKEGTYYLNATAPSTHTFTLQSAISANADKIYENIYKQGDSFFEGKNDVVPHDIPLQPLGNPYTGAIAKLVEGMQSSERIGGNVIYHGYVTFPFARVCIPTKSEPVCKFADRRGGFTISIPDSEVPLEYIAPLVYKVDLRTGQLGDYAPQKANPTEGYDPILKYVAGKATDGNGVVIPFAEVAVRQKSNKQLIYQMKADAQGVFSITADKLPIFDYYLEFVDPATKKVVKETTGQFVKKNTSYFKEQKVDVMKGTVEGKAVPLTQSNYRKSNAAQQGATPIPEKKTGATSSVNMSVIMMVLGIMALVGVGIGVVVYMKQKNGVVPPQTF